MQTRSCQEIELISQARAEHSGVRPLCCRRGGWSSAPCGAELFFPARRHITPEELRTPSGRAGTTTGREQSFAHSGVRSSSFPRVADSL